MLAGFPYPYDDELLYSVLARYCSRVRPFSMQSVNQQLFGCPAALTSVQCPTRLQHLALALADQWNLSTEQLIGLLTVYPFQQPFLDHERAQALRTRMTRGSGTTKISISRRDTVPEYFRYCPVCASQERQTLGEAYWHRLHQLVGVEVCAIHEVWLEKSSVPTRALGAWHKFVAAEGAIRNCCSKPVHIQEPGRDTLFQLARDATWLLKQASLPSDPIALWKRYRFLLREQGLCSYRGKLSLPKFLTRFHRMCPPTCLSRVAGTSRRVTSGTAFIALSRKPRGGAPPLYHLLLMQCLGKTAEEFFFMPEEPSDFGTGPWPCLNKVARHYKELVVTKCAVQVQKDGGRPVGRFSCDCGFEYVRVGPDWGPLARYSYTRVARYGPLWDDKFKHLWSTAEHTLQFISQQVGVAEKNLSLHAARLKLPVWRREHGRAAIPSRKRTWRGHFQQPTKATVLSIREQWTTLCLLKSLSGAPRREKRRLYHWLFRHDHAWLITQPHRPRIPRQAGSHTRVDWNERDQFLAQVLERQSLIPFLSGHHRISMNKLIRQSGYRHLIQPNLHRLPATRATLNRIVTSHMPED